MLGSFRFFLAVCVAVYHLSNRVPNIGQYAVECFYVISGYLMTLVLNETYKFKLLGFAENRFLRLYPSYYAISIVSAILWFCCPSMPTFNLSWKWTSYFPDYISNAVIFLWSMPLGYPFQFRIIPPTWSIAIEIACYALLWLFVARKWWLAAITLFAEAIWHAHTFIVDPIGTSRYFPVTGALLAFSIGSLTYWIANIVEAKRPDWSKNDKNQAIFLAFWCAAFLLNWYASARHGNGFTSPCFYIDMLIAAGISVTFHRIRASGFLGRIDKWLGDLSYPVFLGHILGGYITWMLMGSPTEIRGWSIAAGGILISIAMGVACVRFIDHPIQRIRGRIRLKSKAGTMPS